MLRWMRVLVALGLASAQAVTSFLGWGPVVLASLLLVLALGYGWPRLTDSPQRWTTTLMLMLFGLLGMASSWLAKAPPFLEWLPVLTAMGLLWAFVQNLARGIEARHAVANVSAQVAGLVVTLSACSWIAAIRLPGDRSIIVVGLVGIILAQCATALPLPARVTSPLALVMGVAGAMLAFAVVPADDPRLFVIVPYGMVMGGLVVALDRLLGMIAVAPYQAGSLRQNAVRSKARQWGVQLSLGAAPIAMAGVVVYVLERIPGMV
ncbi:ammonia permease [Brevibacterium sp. BRM-1]|uniref:ammonia permease n=1 Tax=Brevibacterium sp. BRM-1 TaxID=2999062 RepID=UPI002281DE3C|nr:ammonia permease [Brevibacterium sp. BRM-1]WAL39971.1 ammonia permease [Brevibacterium sp. BRM-1]